MTTGPQHYQAAEQLLEIATDMRHPSGYRRYCTETAQVHATLANTAALAAAFAVDIDVDADAEEWRRILGLAAARAIHDVEVPAEALVTCDGACGLEDCRQPIGHDQVAPELPDLKHVLPQVPSEMGEPCTCGHGYLTHSGRLNPGEPRGVCLTNCGCLVYTIEAAAALVRPYVDVAAGVDPFAIPASQIGAEA